MFFIAWYFHLGRCSNTDRSHHGETTAFESSTQVKFASECSKRMFADITAGNTATVNDTVY